MATIDRSPITVPFPVGGQGSKSVGSRTADKRLHIPLRTSEFNDVERAIRLTECSKAEFARWCVLFVTQELLARKAKLESDDV